VVSDRNLGNFLPLLNSDFMLRAARDTKAEKKILGYGVMYRPWEKYVITIEVRLFYIALQDIKTVPAQTPPAIEAGKLLEPGVQCLVGK